MVSFYSFAFESFKPFIMKRIFFSLLFFNILFIVSNYFSNV
jgi:hypothetical protein